MRIKYHRDADRKKLVVAAAEQLGVSPTYAGAPTMNYIVGAYTVACDRTLAGPDDRELVAALRQQGYYNEEYCVWNAIISIHREQSFGDCVNRCCPYRTSA